MLRSITVAFAVALVATSVPGQQVHVVGPQITMGVQFTVIQDAVDAAADGDVILVRGGASYAPFVIHDKALIVVGDAPSKVSVSGTSGNGVTVRATAAGKSVVVRNLAIASESGVFVFGCQGPVAFEDCSATGTYAPLGSAIGAGVTNATHVSFTRCTLRGGQSGGVLGTTGHPDPGLVVAGGTLHLHSTTVIGASPWPAPSWIADGAAGTIVSVGSVHATRTTFSGGSGKPGSPPKCLPGRGGDALVVYPGCSADLLDAVLEPGLGGSGGGCPNGQPGLPIGGHPIGGATGTVNVRPGVAGTFVAPSPVRAGQPLPLQISGPPGDVIFLVASARQAPVFVSICNGTIHPDLGTGIAVIPGIMPATGQLTLMLQVPPNLGALAVPLHMQVVLARTSGCFVADPTALLLLDRSL